MAVPTNLTPETATAIAVNALPYTQTVSAADLSDTPTGTGYASTCDSTQYKALWWAYTTAPTQTFLSITGGNGGSSYSPRVSVWHGPLGGLTQYVLPGQNYCGNLGGTPSYWFQLTVQPNTRYYFQFTDVSALAADAPLVLQLRAAPQLAAPAGSVVIPNDDDGFPAVVMALTDGTPVRIVDIPANEFADTLPTCRVALNDFNLDGGNITVYQGDLTTVVGTYTSATDIRALKSNRRDRIYFIANPGSPQTVGYINESAVFGGVTWTLPADSALARCFAVTQDNSIVYYGSETASAVIHAYDLVNSIALPDLHAAFGTEWLHCHGDGLALADGSVLFGYSADALGTTGKIRRFDAAGTVLNTYTLGATFNKLNRFCYVDEYSFLAWGYASVSMSVFRLIKISDGSTIHEWQVEDIGTGGGSSTTPTPISETCPVFVLPYSDNGSLTTPGSGGCGLAAPDVPVPAPDDGIPPPDDELLEEPIRWVRIAPILADNDDHHNIRWVRIEVIAQTGYGALTFQMRRSYDSGWTWSAYESISLGQVGQYDYRGYTWSLGISRQLMIELVNTDPGPVNVQSVLLSYVVGAS